MNYYASTPQAQGYTPRQTRGAFNQQLAEAQAAADPRYNMKPMDRAGFSRGGAQRSMAGISSAQNLANGIAKAYAGQLEDARANAGITLGNQRSQEQAGLGLNSLQQQMAYQAALDSLQRQQNAMNFNQNLLGGLIGTGGLSGFLGF
jgi:hypothetical protein